MIFKVAVPALLSLTCPSPAAYLFRKRRSTETQCISGKVLQADTGSGGVHYLDFCEDYQSCPFSAVIFSYDLKNAGDVRQLEGKAMGAPRSIWTMPDS